MFAITVSALVNILLGEFCTNLVLETNITTLNLILKHKTTVTLIKYYNYKLTHLCLKPDEILYYNNYFIHITLKLQHLPNNSKQISLILFETVSS